METLFKSITKDFILPFYLNNVKLDIINGNIELSNSNVDKNDFGKINDFYKQQILVELSYFNQMLPIFENVKEDIGKYKSGFFSIDKELLCGDNAFENEHLIHRFAYQINFSKQLNIHKYFENLKIAFYFEHGINRINGSFIFEKKLYDNLTYDQSIDYTYMYNLITNFFKKHFYPFSIDEFNKIFNSKNSEYKINELHKLWIETVNDKILNDSSSEYLQTNGQEIRDHLFYDMINIWAISLSYIQLINNLFTNKNYLMLKNKFNTNKKHQEKKSLTSKEIFFKINDILKNKFMIKEKISKKRTWLDKLSKLETKLENSFISEPSMLVDVVPTTNYSNRNINDYFNNPLYFEYFINILYSEYLQTNSDNLDDYNSLENVKKSLKLFNKIDYAKYIDEVEKTLCENNLYYFSLIKKHEGIIVSKNKDFHQKSNYRYLYIWSKIFVETKVKELEELKKIRVVIDNSTIRWKNIPFRKLMQDIKDISFNKHSHFFGIKNIHSIVDKYNQEFNFSKDIITFNNLIQLDDEIYKRATERSNFVMVYIVAIIIGFINYFAMVYSATSDTGIVQNGWPGLDATFPWVGTSLFVVVLIQIFAASILAFAFFRFMYIKHKYKEIDLHIYY